MQPQCIVKLINKIYYNNIKGGQVTTVSCCTMCTSNIDINIHLLGGYCIFFFIFSWSLFYYMTAVHVVHFFFVHNYFLCKYNYVKLCFIFIIMFYPCLGRCDCKWGQRWYSNRCFILHLALPPPPSSHENQPYLKKVFCHTAAHQDSYDLWPSKV